MGSFWNWIGAPHRPVEWGLGTVELLGDPRMTVCLGGPGDVTQARVRVLPVWPIGWMSLGMRRCSLCWGRWLAVWW